MSGELLPEIWEKIKTTLRFALENEYSSFYRNKYKPFALDKIETFKTSHDFFRLPFLTRSELEKTHPLKRLFIPETEVERVTFTSGTTSSQPLILFRQHNIHSVTRALKKKTDTSNIKTDTELYDININPKRALLLVKPHQIPTYHCSLKSQGFLVLTGDIYRLKETAKLAAELQINTIQSTPTLLLHFIPFLASVYDLKKIKFIRCSGERISKLLHDLLKEKFSEAHFIFRYGLQEIGYIGVKCNSLVEQDKVYLYHLRSNLVFGEIISLKKDRSGELAITSLKKSATPLIRYRTGDIIKFIDKTCACGSKTPLFEVLGRKNLDRLKIGGAEFLLKDFDSVLGKSGEYIEDAFEVHFYEELIGEKIVPKITVSVELKDKSDKTDFIKNMLEEALNNNLQISKKYSFKELVAQGFFKPIEVNFFERPKTQYKTPIAKKLIPHF